MASNSPDDPTPLEEFLAAPEEVATSETERKKLKERRLRDEARLERERRRKSDEPPTQEDILADLIRVAEDPDLNPFHEHRSLSRRRYELHGRYYLEDVTRTCGQFEHAKQQAGLAIQVGERAFARARTRASLAEHDARYMERYILPHVDKHPELRRANTGHKSLLVISDLHGLFLDPFTWHVFVETARDLVPDVVYLNGDVIDGLDISAHPKVPGVGVPLQLEFDFTVQLLKELRLALPRANIVWGAGNHFLDRVVRYLTQVSRGVAGLRSLRIDHMLDPEHNWLKELDIDLVQGGTFVSPEGTEEDEPRRVLWDTYMVTHGTKLGMTPAKAELQQWGMSGTSGHVHRAAIHHGSTRAHQNLSWMCTPMSCTPDAGRAYMKDHIGWQMGFGVVFISPQQRVHHYPVITDGGEAWVEGNFFQRGPDMPTGGRAAKQYWLDRFDLNPGNYI